jgi:hypothetical protein
MAISCFSDAFYRTIARRQQVTSRIGRAYAHDQAGDLRLLRRSPGWPPPSTPGGAACWDSGIHIGSALGRRPQEPKRKVGSTLPRSFTGEGVEAPYGSNERALCVTQRPDVARSLSAKTARANRFAQAHKRFAALDGMVTIRREGNSLGGVERLASDELEGL